MKNALTQPESLIQAVFDLTGVALYVTDPHGRFVKANAAFSQLLGYTQEELLDLTERDIIHPDDRESTERSMTDIIAGDAVSFRIEKRYVHRNGNTVWADVSLTVIRDEERAVVAVVGALIVVIIGIQANHFPFGLAGCSGSASSSAGT